MTDWSKLKSQFTGEIIHFDDSISDVIITLWSVIAVKLDTWNEYTQFYSGFKWCNQFGQSASIKWLNVISFTVSNERK